MNYTLVGAFVLVLGAVLVAGVLWLASGGILRAQYDTYMAIENESVAGLNLDAPVKYNGVDVGKVRSIRLEPDNPSQVILLLSIKHGTPVKEDTFAVLQTQGLTGIAFVELGGGAPSAPLLTATPGYEYPVIRTKPSLSARLENVLTNVLAKLDSTSKNINAILSDENRTAFRNALADMATVAHTFAQRKDAIDAGIVNANRTLENTARVSAQAGPMIDRIGRSAEAVEKMSNAAAQASDKIGKTFDAADVGVTRVTTEVLPELQRLLGEMDALSASLRRLSEKIEGSPGGVLVGRRPVPPGPGEGAQQ